jgi:hypothetical protein
VSSIFIILFGQNPDWSTSWSRSRKSNFPSQWESYCCHSKGMLNAASRSTQVSDLLIWRHFGVSVEFFSESYESENSIPLGDRTPARSRKTKISLDKRGKETIS